MRKHYLELQFFFKSLMILSSLILMNFIILFFSNLYLSLNKVFIIEQDAFSYYNTNYLLILLSIILFFLTWYVFFRLNTNKIKKISRCSKKYPHKKLHIFLLAFILLLIIISYLNIFIFSNKPPFFSESYINRIGYLESTKLWIILRPFGAVIIIIPIVLGYLKACKYYYRKSSFFLYLLFVFYILYLIFIGQKFSGLILGIFYFVSPQLVLTIQKKKKVITLNRVVILFLIILVLYQILIFHYSSNSIAMQIGDPVRFILYRIFTLQGHMSWGYYNHYDLLTFEPFKMYHAMHNMMSTVGDPIIVESMLERGVNFTGAFPTIVFFSFPMPIDIIILIIIFYLYVKFSFYILKYIDTLYYILLMYIFNYIITYFSRGSIEEIINLKTVGLTIIILMFKIVNDIAYRKSDKNEPSIATN